MARRTRGAEEPLSLACERKLSWPSCSCASIAPSTRSWEATTTRRAPAIPPLRHGSRFGTRHERGIWYGAETRRPAFAEVAYYRFLFLAETEADLGTLTTALTVFTVHARSARGVDLLDPPFEVHRQAIASATSYAASPVLGAAMREAGVELVRYPSARDAFAFRRELFLAEGELPVPAG
ncbi:MAG: RES family NAD+ phosphorylase [Gemmatimonadaceae bacterium]